MNRFVRFLKRWKYEFITDRKKRKVADERLALKASLEQPNTKNWYIDEELYNLLDHGDEFPR